MAKSVWQDLSVRIEIKFYYFLSLKLLIETAADDILICFVYFSDEADDSHEMSCLFFSLKNNFKNQNVICFKFV